MQSSQSFKAGRGRPRFLLLRNGLAGESAFAAFLDNLLFCLFYQRREVCADAIGYSKRQFQSRTAETALDEAQHGFGNTRALRDGIVGKSPALSLLLQESNDFITDGFVVADSRHAKVWLKKRFDIYFAIVKHRRRAGAGGS